MAQTLKFHRPGVVEAIVTVSEDGKCHTQHPENLTPQQKRDLAEALRRLSRTLRHRTN